MEEVEQGLDIKKQIEAWKEGALEDLEAAQTLLADRKPRHALFFAHLSVEKMLKAHLIASGKVLTKIHSLPRLAQLSGLALPAARQEFLNRFDLYQIGGRYPEEIRLRISNEDAGRLFSEVKETVEWLIRQL
jgi:HEPN domain-containing protein